MEKILFTGFKSKNKWEKNSSEKLMEQIKKQDTFLFFNDYTRIIYEIDEIMAKGPYDYIIMFGQKPALKRLSLEMTCKCKNEILKTNFKVDELIKILNKRKIMYKISHAIGSSYCNFAYYNLLKCMQVNKIPTKVLFIHIPFLSNFIEMDKLVDLLNKEKE